MNHYPAERMFTESQMNAFAEDRIREVRIDERMRGRKAVIVSWTISLIWTVCVGGSAARAAYEFGFGWPLPLAIIVFINAIWWLFALQTWFSRKR